MTDLFVPIWLAFGFLMAICAMMGMAISTKSGPMALMPLVSFGAFVVVTMANDHHSALSIIGLSLLAFSLSWFAITLVYLMVSYVRHKSEECDKTY